MSYHIDRKYSLLISVRLDQFKQKGDGVCQFRCPFCGDSKKNKIKARGYFYRKKHGICFQCHNCSISMSLGTFINRLDPTLYREYQIDRFKDEHVSPGVKKPDFKEFKTSAPVFEKTIKLPTIESLPDTHSAKKYILSRKIPNQFLKELYYADDFLSFVDDIFPEHGKNLIKDEARIVIPFYSKEGSLQGIQGRALSDSKIRYITIKKTPEATKLFGLDKVDLSKTIHVVEGALDSMFIENAIAMMDSSLYLAPEKIGKNYDFVFIYDNQPRNKEIVGLINKTIGLGYRVVIWPGNLYEKDINDMILAGLNPQHIISENIYQKHEARLKLTQWCRV